MITIATVSALAKDRLNQLIVCLLILLAAARGWLYVHDIKTASRVTIQAAQEAQKHVVQADKSRAAAGHAAAAGRGVLDPHVRPDGR